MVLPRPPTTNCNYTNNATQKIAFIIGVLHLKKRHVRHVDNREGTGKNRDEAAASAHGASSMDKRQNNC